MENDSPWNKIIPWYLTITCTIALLAVFILLYKNLEWFKNSAINDPDLMKSSNYRIYIYSSHLGMVKRSLGIITGVSISFIGLSVCFYALASSTNVELTGMGKIASFSPGLIAIFLGCFLIFVSIDSKDTITFAPQKSSKNEISDSSLNKN